MRGHTRDIEFASGSGGGHEGADDASRLFAGTMATTALTLGCGVVTGVLAARLLGPDGRGVIAAVVFWPQLIASLGILSIQEAAAFRIGTGGGSCQRTGAAALWLSVLLAISAIVFAWLALPALLGERRADQVAPARLYMLAFAPFNFAWLALLGLDLGALRVHRHNLFRLAVPASYMVLVLGLWLAGEATVTTVLAANLVAVAAAGASRLFMSRDLLAKRPSISEMHALLREGLGFHAATALLVLSTQLDRLLAVRILDDTSLGFYVVAFTLCSVPVVALGTPFHTVLFPKLAQADRGERAHLLSRGIRGAMLATVLTCALVALLAAPLVHLLYGAAFSPAIALVRLLAAAFVFVGLKQVIIRSIRGIGEAKAGARAEALGIAVFVLVAWPLAGTLGAAGIGLALGIANVPPLVWLLFFLNRRVGIGMREMWGLSRRGMVELAEWSRLSWRRAPS